MTGRILDPVTGRPFESGPRTPLVPGPLPKAVQDQMQAQGHLLGIAIYDCTKEDNEFIKFVPADDDGNLAETIVAQDGQVLVVAMATAKIAPANGTTVTRIEGR